MDSYRNAIPPLEGNVGDLVSEESAGVKRGAEVVSARPNFAKSAAAQEVRRAPRDDTPPWDEPAQAPIRPAAPMAMQPQVQPMQQPMPNMAMPNTGTPMAPTAAASGMMGTPI